MDFKLSFTLEAASVLKQLENENHPKLKKVRKALGLLETNPRHPGLAIRTGDFPILNEGQGANRFAAQCPGAFHDIRVAGFGCDT